MLKKYTKYVATAFAVASLSIFMIGCGAAEEEYTGPPIEGTEDPTDTEGAGATNDNTPPLDGE